MINPIELIEEYKEQGYSCEEAVQMAKKELKEKKAHNRASNRNEVLKRLNNPAARLSEETYRGALRTVNHTK